MFGFKEYHLLLVIVTVFVFPESKANGHPAGYLTLQKDEHGKVYEVVFEGDAEWLAKQDDPQSHFHKLPDLEYLTLVRHRISNEEMRYIATLKKVNSLNVGSVAWGLPEDQVQIQGESLSYIGDMTWLEELEVETTGLSDKDWSFLPKLKGLKILRTGPDLQLSDGFLQFATKNKFLEELNVAGSKSVFSDDAYARIAALRRLKILRVGSPNLTDVGVKAVTGLTDLEVLSLSGNLTAKSIDYLRPLKKLRELKLDIKHIPKSAMETIAQLKNLEQLSLYNAEIGDEEIEVLRDHPSLKDICLDSAHVTNRSLEILNSLDKLEYVTIRGDSESKRIEEEINKRIKLKKSATVVVPPENSRPAHIEPLTPSVLRRESRGSSRRFAFFREGCLSSGDASIG